MKLKGQCVQFKEGNVLYLGHIKADFFRKLQSNTATSLEQDPYWYFFININIIILLG